MNPGDTLEGHGLLLQHGRLIAQVDYHLAIPGEIYFLTNPTHTLHPNYDSYLSGFILLTHVDAGKISLAEYTLELADKTKKTIRVERRYKKTKRKGEEFISFWVKVI
jgi:hypothetical protein